MADGPYRHYGAGNGQQQQAQQQQQQQFFYQQQAHSRHIARTGSPIIGSRTLYTNDTPSPSRSPVSQSSSHPFAMFGQGQSNMMNGSGHQRYMQMNAGHKYQPHQTHQHHNQQNQHHQQNNGGHPGHLGLGHQHTFSGTINLATTQNFNAALQNGALNDDHTNIGESLPEHWQIQLQLVAETRSNSHMPHRHSKKSGAAIPAKSVTQIHTEEPKNDGELVDRNRITAEVEDSRQDWDGMDISGQGLRCLAPRMFHDYTFLTKLYLDNNKLSILPPNISHLRFLTVLQASNNQLRELPDTIGMLSRLEELLVFDNNIRTLPTQIGYLPKLEMLGIEGNPLDEDIKEFLMQKGTAALVLHLRDNTPAPQAPRARQKIILDDSEAAEKFTVLDYNILCDKYASPTLYNYCPARALDWSYRRDLIFAEIKAHDADFLCLQEIDMESFEDFFRRELAFYHYQGIFWPKSRARTMAEREAKAVDGCAIFYKSQKYILLDKHLIDFANTAINRLDMKGEHDIFNRVMPKDHIAVVAFFENRMTGSRMIVTNAHIHWDPNFTDVKLVQVAILMEELTKRAEKWAKHPPKLNKQAFRHADAQDSNGHDPDHQIDPSPPAGEPLPSLEYASGASIPIVICGDFNIDKDTSVYQLLAHGSVPPDHPDLAGRSYGSFTREGMSHPFTLREAYGGEPKDYIEFTNYTPGFSGRIDYIWHSTTLRRRQLLGDVDFDYLDRIPGFPHWHFPSDHLPLFAEFSVEPRKERAKAVEADFGPQRDRRN